MKFPKTYWKILRLAGVTFIVISLAIRFQHGVLQSSCNQSSSDAGSEQSKIILLWNTLHTSPTFKLRRFGQLPFIENHCHYNNCFTTNDRLFLPLASAVVFHMIKNTQGDFPKTRPAGQLYVQLLTESPGYRYNKITTDDVMNVTITYRRDSDIFYPYKTYRPRESPIPGPYISPYNISGRTKSVVWLVSNCKTMIRREDYVSELTKFIDVDIMGKCGDIECSKRNASCYLNQARDYRFHISFENSFCVDYITEKAFRPMDTDLVPIVLGGTNYTRDLPPHSFINVMDYESPRALAKYLKYLSHNMTAYMEYLQWKQDYEIVRSEVGPPFCKLCEILHDKSYRKTYPNFSEWWSDDKCVDDPLADILPR